MKRRMVLGFAPITIPGKSTGEVRADVAKSFEPQRMIITDDRGPIPWHWKILRLFMPGLVQDWKEQRKYQLQVIQIYVNEKANMIGAEIPSVIFAPERFDAGVELEIPRVGSVIRVQFRNDFKRANRVHMVMMGDQVE